MAVPLRVTVKDVPEARALRGTINTLADRLVRDCDRIVACGVVIESDRAVRDDSFNVSLELVLSDNETVRTRDSSNRLDEALYDSFDAARVRLRRVEAAHAAGAAPAAASRKYLSA